MVHTADITAVIIAKNGITVTENQDIVFKDVKDATENLIAYKVRILIALICKFSIIYSRTHYFYRTSFVGH
jgi:hypothetical protein